MVQLPVGVSENVIWGSNDRGAACAKKKEITQLWAV